MVTRSSLQHASRRQALVLRIVFYTTLVALVAAYSSALADWHRSQIAQYEAAEARLATPPVRVVLGNTSLYAPASDYRKPQNFWVLANKSHPIVPSEYAPKDLVPVPLPVQPQLSGEQAMVRAAVARALSQLAAGAAQAGHNLMINSAYRSYSLQQELLETGSNDLYDTGTRTAPAGASEHQLGLAVDFSTDTMSCRMSANCAISDDDAAWLADHAYEYGFLLRYPEGREATTGYQYEPWHYRYVGNALAKPLHEQHLVLEDAWPALEHARAELIKRGELSAS